MRPKLKQTMEKHPLNDLVISAFGGDKEKGP
jgi:hypothetical protein